VIPDRERYAPGMARQLEALQAARSAGMPRLGWKIGINVPDVLQRLGLSHPGVAWLDGRSRLESGAVFSAAAGSQLHVEPELGLWLAAPIAPGSSAEEAVQQVAAVSPVLELVDYARPGTDLDAVVAHGMFHAGCVVAGRVGLAEARDLGTTWPLIEVSGRPGGPARSDLVPARLGELLVFVAEFLDCFGESLARGDLLISGSFTAKAMPVPPGAEARADFGPLGTVSVRIAS
jgi:2-keto-4-pentenoate hydratase